MAALALTACGGDDGGSGGEGKAEGTGAPVTAEQYAACAREAGFDVLSPVPRKNESDTSSAMRDAGVDLDQLTVSSPEGSVFVAVLPSEADAEKALPAAQRAAIEERVRHYGNVILPFYTEEEVAAFDEKLRACAP